MKYFKNLLVIILIFFINCSCAQAQNNYSSAAIVVFNSGVKLHNQREYELAAQKYVEALKLQPNFTAARKYLAAIYPNLAYKYYSSSEYEKSINYAQKSLALTPNDIYSYKVMAQSYLALNDKESAIKYYRKIISIDANDTDSMHSIAQIYLKSNQFNKASETYQEILLIKPNDSMAQQNLKYTNFQNTEKTLKYALNSIKTEHTAPPSLYKLIKPAAGTTPKTVDQMKTILDLIWSEPNGQIMLQTLMKKRTPIKITEGYVKANARRTSRSNTFYLYGFIPIATIKTDSSEVNIPFTHIANFNNPNLSSHMRIYNLQVFIHEFGHAFIGIKNPKDTNSIEEELGVSMVGYNIAHKVITGKYLDKSQTETYSNNALEGLLLDEHRDLPVFSGFNDSIQKFGIALPYPEVYTNIPLMYKTLLMENKVKPAPTFYPYVKGRIAS